MSHRNDQSLDNFYDRSTIKASSKLTNEPFLPATESNRRDSTMDDGTPPHRFACPKDKYRQAYFEALDLAKQNLLCPGTL